MEKAYTRERQLVETQEEADLQPDDALESQNETEEIIINDSGHYSAPVRIGLAAPPPGNNNHNNQRSAKYLQNAYGNIAALRHFHQITTLQPKLRSAPPLDKYEREADQFVDFAFNPQADRPSLSPSQPLLQRLPAGGSADSQGSATAAIPPTAPSATEKTSQSNLLAPGLIVEDSASESSSDQMTKSEFLSQLNANVCTSAESALAGTIWSAVGCPWIDHWFS